MMFLYLFMNLQESVHYWKLIKHRKKGPRAESWPGSAQRREQAGPSRPAEARPGDFAKRTLFF